MNPGDVRFAVGMGVIFASLLAGMRIITQVGWGAVPVPMTQAEFPIGLIGRDWLHDNLQHLSWARQSRDGRWFYDDPFTWDESPAVLVNPILGLVGHLARAIGCEPVFLLNLGSVLSAAVFPWLIMRLGRAFGLASADARWSTALVCFSTGLSAPIAVMHHFELGLDIPLGTDVTYPDSNSLACFVAFPFVAICQALAVVILVIILHCERPESRMGWLRLTALATGLALHGLSHPYEHLIIATSYLAWVIGMVCMGSDRQGIGRRIALAALLMLASGCVLAYHSWLNRQPVWEQVVESSTRLPRARAEWLVGYGLLLPLALWGFSALRHRSQHAWWLLGWVLGLVAMLVGWAIPQTKVCSLGHVPMCFLAGVGVRLLLCQMARMGIRSMAVVLILAGLFGTTPWFLWTQTKTTPMMPSDLWSAMEHLRRESGRRPHVLADTRTSRLVVAYCDAKVFAGNFYKTPDFLRRAIELRLLGLEPGDSDAPAVNQIAWPTHQQTVDRWRRFQRQVPIDFVLADHRSPLARVLREEARMREFSFGAWVLFQR